MCQDFVGLQGGSSSLVLFAERTQSSSLVKFMFNLGIQVNLDNNTF